MKGLLATSTLALLVAAVSVSTARDARGGQPDEQAQTSPGSMSSERTDASDINVDEVEGARVQAEYERLKVEHEELEARLASLEERAKAEKGRHPRPPAGLGPWEGLGLYGLSLVLAALWSRPWKGGRRS
jgi:hypothetical protein